MAGRFQRGMTLDEAHVARLEQQIEDLQRQLQELRTHEAPSSHSRRDSDNEENYRREESRRGSSPEYRRPERRAPTMSVQIPEFEGNLDPEEFIDWMHTIERIFEYEEVPEDKMVKMAALKLRKYASLWWENTNQQRRREGRDKIRTWAKMKRAMTRRFLPEHYRRDLYLKLQSLQQVSSVSEYTREFERLLLQCDVQEAPEQTIARYLRGLKPQIADAVELQQYWSFDDIRTLAHKVEQQQTRKPTNRPFMKASPFNEGSSAQPKEQATNSKKPPSTNAKPEARSTDRRCFKCQGLGHMASECPNRRNIILREQSEDEEDVVEHPLPTPIWDHKAIEAYPDEGELLVIRRALSLAPGQEESQRESIFNTRCTIKDKVCSVIIDSGSCTNASSKKIMGKLQLSVEPHPHPYRLQWLNETSDVRVTEQVRVPFSIGNNYKDEVVCDVIPMDACHLLLGRPWQYDRRAQYDGFHNTYSISIADKKIMLIPLTSPTAAAATNPNPTPTVKSVRLMLPLQEEDESHSLCQIEAAQDPHNMHPLMENRSTEPAWDAGEECFEELDKGKLLIVQRCHNANVASEEAEQQAHTMEVHQQELTLTVRGKELSCKDVELTPAKQDGVTGEVLVMFELTQELMSIDLRTGIGEVVCQEDEDHSSLRTNFLQQGENDTRTVVDPPQLQLPLTQGIISLTTKGERSRFILLRAQLGTRKEFSRHLFDKGKMQLEQVIRRPSKKVRAKFHRSISSKLLIAVDHQYQHALQAKLWMCQSSEGKPPGDKSI